MYISSFLSSPIKYMVITPFQSLIQYLIIIYLALYYDILRTMMPTGGNFAPAERYAHHIAVHAADLALKPPEAYLFVQDSLVLGCAICWAVGYWYLIKNTLKDGRSPMPTHVYAFNLAYELYYGLAIPSTNTGRFFYVTGWFALDAIWMGAALYVIRHKAERIRVFAIVSVESLVLLLVYHWTAKRGVDTQKAAYWYGILALFVDTVGGLYLMWKHGDTKGLSVKMGLIWFFGTISAMGVFYWRYINVPDNWSYFVGLPSLMAWAVCWVLIVVFGITAIRLRYREYRMRKIMHWKLE